MMTNQFPHEGHRGFLITWAKGIVEEAFALDPVFMEERAIDIFGSLTFWWTSPETTDAKIHAICRAAMLVRLRAGQES